MNGPVRFFLCGPPKSGTTWLQLMLHAHPEVLCAGEGHLTDWIISPIRTLLETYNRQVQDNNELIYRDRATHVGFTERDFKDLTQFIVDQRFARLYPVKPEALAVGDKTPNYVYGLELLSAIDPECLSIYLVRDPRDAAVSMYHQTRWLEERNGKRMYGSDDEILEKYLKKWVEMNRLYLRYRDKHPDRTLSLRYEDLMAGEAPGVTDALALLGVSGRQDLVAQCIEAGRFSELSGGRNRGQTDDRSFYRRGEVGAWQSELDGRADDFVTDDAQLMMAEFGYAR